MKCIQCQSEMSLIPAGISRTSHKPYDAFWACPNRCKQEKPKQSFGTQYARSAQQGEQIQKTIDYKSEKIEEAQDRKDEAMKLLNAKNAGADITVALIEKGFIQPRDIESNFSKYCDFVYNYYPKKSTVSEDEIVVNNIPF